MSTEPSPAQPYQLIDFGRGRKLERFGPYVVDRPCPAARGPQQRPEAWQRASGRYDQVKEPRWSPEGGLPESWTLSIGPLVVLRIRPSPFGHMGVFPEQIGCWDWIGRMTAGPGRRLKVLNLFGYTGGATLAAAAAGAEVVHVDAARNAVARARENATLSGLDEASVRWIDEDAAAFVRRELRRGNRYDAAVLDPPSYGHGPKGQVWKIGRDLDPLLAACAELLAARPAFVLLTCHSPGLGPAELGQRLAAALRLGQGQRLDTGELEIVSSGGRRLPCGAFARWP